MYSIEKRPTRNDIISGHVKFYEETEKMVSS